jgi:hypothetical protein
LKIRIIEEAIVMEKQEYDDTKPRPALKAQGFVLRLKAAHGLKPAKVY